MAIQKDIEDCKCDVECDVEECEICKKDYPLGYGDEFLHNAHYVYACQNCADLHAN